MELVLGGRGSTHGSGRICSVPTLHEVGQRASGIASK